jgi:hypothetical protein
VTFIQIFHNHIAKFIRNCQFSNNCFFKACIYLKLWIYHLANVGRKDHTVGKQNSMLSGRCTDPLGGRGRFLELFGFQYMNQTSEIIMGFVTSKRIIFELITPLMPFNL